MTVKFVIYIWLFNVLLHCVTYAQYFDESGEDGQIKDLTRNNIAKVNCGEKLMTLEVARKYIPSGMGFLSSNSETLSRSDSHPSGKCLSTATNDRVMFYALSLDCVSSNTDNSTWTFYHEARIGIVSKYYMSQTDLPQQLYTLSMECAYSNQAKTKLMRSKTALIENRQSCNTSGCGFDEFCIDASQVTGYTCPGADCEPGSTSCISHSGVGEVMCIDETKACDGISDCNEGEDEVCYPDYDQWSEWSACKEGCDSTKSFRKRACSKVATNGYFRTVHSCKDDVEEKSCPKTNCLSITCTSDSMVISMPLGGNMESNAVLSNFKLNSEMWESGVCAPTVNSTHANFLIPHHMCGTDTWSDGETIYYSNEITVSVPTVGATIIRKAKGHSYLGTCHYNRENNVVFKTPVNSNENRSSDWEGSVEIAALSIDQESGDDFTEHFTSGEGEFMFLMKLYPDDSFTIPYTPYDYPLKKKIGERIYAEVSILSEDEDLKVSIKKCWATTGLNEQKPKKEYVFIDNGCSIDITTKLLSSNRNNPSQLDRFSIETFRFIGEKRPLLYFRCDVVVCDASETDSECFNNCGADENDVPKNRHRRVKRETAQHVFGHVQQGPILVFDAIGSVQYATKNDIDRFKTNHGANSGSISPMYLTIAAIIGLVGLLGGVVIGMVIKWRFTHSQRASV